MVVSAVVRDDPPLLRGIIPVMEASVQVAITAEGRVTYQPRSRESPNESPPETKLLPPDLVDTERYPI